jgi:haloalkane dehalogenase
MQPATTSTSLAPDPAGGRSLAVPALGLALRSIALESGEIAYLDEGSGPVILLLHGAPITSLGFVRVIRELRAHYRVIAPDFPGFGQSAPAAGFGGSLREHARFVGEFCAALELRRFYAYVNDSSACVGLSALAGLAPEVAGVVVASTVPLPLTGRAWPVKLVLRHVVGSRLFRSLNRRFNLLPWLVARVAPFLRPFSPAERAALLAQFDTDAKRDRIIDMFRHMGRDDDFMGETAACVGERLAATPALLLFGQFDPMRFLGGVGRWKRLLPRSSVCIIRFEEHFPILASGARVGRAVHDWIARET